MGGQGQIAPMPRIEEVDDLDGGEGYPIITGDYTATPRWASRPVTVGTPIAKPSPVFAKLDPSVVEEELARLAPEGNGDESA
jgi:methionyl-tRNA synthetase